MQQPIKAKKCVKIRKNMTASTSASLKRVNKSKSKSKESPQKYLTKRLQVYITVW